MNKWNRPSSIHCPLCLKAAYRIPRRGPVDAMLFVFSRFPFACGSCGYRFHSSNRKEFPLGSQLESSPSVQKPAFGVGKREK